MQGEGEKVEEREKEMEERKGREMKRNDCVDKVVAMNLTNRCKGDAQQTKDTNL